VAAATSQVVQVERRDGGLVAASFVAMASPCQVLFATTDLQQARQLGELAAAEAWRIERKYSRYRDDSVIAQLNRSGGERMALDAETTLLLRFAAHCHELSGGAFDITSGVLRRAWRFDGSNQLPDPALVEALRAQVGFERLQFDGDGLRVPPGMELDLGGIGKEYAVDRALALVCAAFDGAALVNFGGDLAANHAPPAGPWKVGVERPESRGETRLLLDFERGGLATSGDTHRCIEHQGRRYGHILDVRSGWPVRDAPRSITVAAASCVEAGMIATLAMLQGADAEEFLAGQGVVHWCLRQD
jgi:thiamine biosynthesis lipoprotein